MEDSTVHAFTSGFSWLGKEFRFLFLERGEADLEKVVWSGG